MQFQSYMNFLYGVAISITYTFRVLNLDLYCMKIVLEPKDLERVEYALGPEGEEW